MPRLVRPNDRTTKRSARRGQVLPEVNHASAAPGTGARRDSFVFCRRGGAVGLVSPGDYTTIEIAQVLKTLSAREKTVNEGIERLLTSRPEIPCADAVPGVRQLRARLDELRARRDSIAREIADIVSKPTQAAPAVSAAQRLLDGDTEQAVAGPGLDQRLSELRTTQRVIDDALRLGEAELRRLVRLAAPRLLADLQVWHRALVVEAARRVTEAQVLQGAEAALLSDIAEAGLPAVVVGELLHLQPGGWLVERLLSDGILSGNESWLPSDLQRPERPTVVATASAAIGRMARAAAGAVGTKTSTEAFGGTEKWS